MRYKVIISIDIDAPSDLEAQANARKLKELLSSPMVRMAVDGAGVRLVGDGSPVVYQPQRAALSLKSP